MKIFGTKMAIAAVVVAIAIASAAPGSEGGRARRALLPPGRPGVTGVHQLHRPGSPACDRCHPAATSSRWASDRLVPKMEHCAACHPEVEGVTALTPVDRRCVKCHPRSADGATPVPGTYPRPNIRFPHVAHKAHVECAACHPRAGAGRTAVPGQDVVGMRECYGCHRQRGAAIDCRTCHLVRQDGRLLTDLGGERLTPPSWLLGPTHGVDWVQRHAPTAGADSALCASCHREAFCQDCHTGRLRPRNVHPGDWIASHGLGSRFDNPRCRGCHRKQSFCIGCHRRSGVAPDSPSDALPSGGPGRYHGAMSVEQLCRRARYDIGACVSCHSESACISCHSVRKPHPPGWRRKCKPLASRNHRACAKCHADEAWKRCI